MTRMLSRLRSFPAYRPRKTAPTPPNRSIPAPRPAPHRRPAAVPHENIRVEHLGKRNPEARPCKRLLGMQAALRRSPHFHRQHQSDCGKEAQPDKHEFNRSGSGATAYASFPGPGPARGRLRNATYTIDTIPKTRNPMSPRPPDRKKNWRASPGEGRRASSFSFRTRQW